MRGRRVSEAGSPIVAAKPAKSKRTGGPGADIRVCQEDLAGRQECLPHARLATQRGRSIEMQSRPARRPLFPA
jgi:hypothetical protein